MKGVIEALVALAILIGSTAALKKLHDEVRKAALTKAAEGLPSLTEMSTSLSRKARERGSNNN